MLNYLWKKTNRSPYQCKDHRINNHKQNKKGKNFMVIEYFFY